MSSKVEKIIHNGEVYALVLRKEMEEEGIHFVTPEDYPLQVGVQIRKMGDVVKPHMHKSIKKEIEVIQEFIHIVYGKVKTIVYNENDEKISEIILNSGDSLLQAKGGHGFEILEDTKLIEVKQGPYGGVNEDKKRF